MPASAPRLPVMATLEEAVRGVARHLPALALLYVAVWLGLQASTLLLHGVLGGVQGSKIVTIVLLAISAFWLAIFYAGALRIELLGERPSRDMDWWWNAGTRRVLVVLLLVFGVDYVIVAFLTPLLMTGLEPEHLMLDEPSSGILGANGYHTSLWVDRVLRSLTWTSLLGQAAIVITRARFDWREHLRLLGARPLELAAIGLLAGVMIFGFALIWARVIGLVPKMAVPVTSDVRDVIVPTFFNGLRSVPYYALRDSFVVMTVAAAYRRLSGFKPEPAVETSAEPAPYPSP